MSFDGNKSNIVICLSQIFNKFLFFRKQKTGPSVSKVSSSEAKKKAAAPVDFFGSSKVKKETRPVVKKCAEPVKLASNNSSVEIDDFSDDEAFEDPSFMDTLNKLDKKKEKVSFTMTKR